MENKKYYTKKYWKTDWINDLPEKEREHIIQLKQESLYLRSNFLDRTWYRKLYGGEWNLIKMGKDTPYINMFCVWSKLPLSYFSGHIEILQTEKYKETNVITKMKLYKEFFKQQFLSKTV